MDKETEGFLKRKADQFSFHYQRQPAMTPNAEKRFKEDLDMELYSFYEAMDKWIFLSQIHSNFKVFAKDHLTVCDKDPDTCPTSRFYTSSIYFVKQEIRGLEPALDIGLNRPMVNNELIKDTMIAIRAYPEAAKVYVQAIEKLNTSNADRNLLDDFRLTIEVLLKEILKNRKSLENQFDILGSHQETMGVTKEIRSLFRENLKLFCKYQNEYVKHKNSVKSNEVDFMANLSTTLISFLLKCENGS